MQDQTPDVMLYRILSGGQDPPTAAPPANTADQAALQAGLGLAGILEGGSMQMQYECHNCGSQHARWELFETKRLQDVMVAAGMPPPVRSALPYLHLINTRNLRAAFHRCAFSLMLLPCRFWHRSSCTAIACCRLMQRLLLYSIFQRARPILSGCGGKLH